MDKKLDIISFSPMADIGFWSTLAKVQRRILDWKMIAFYLGLSFVSRKSLKNGSSMRILRIFMSNTKPTISEERRLF